jgi:hypothetical protein
VVATHELVKRWLFKTTAQMPERSQHLKQIRSGVMGATQKREKQQHAMMHALHAQNCTCGRLTNSCWCADVHQAYEDFRLHATTITGLCKTRHHHPEVYTPCSPMMLPALIAPQCSRIARSLYELLPPVLLILCF